MKGCHVRRNGVLLREGGGARFTKPSGASRDRITRRRAGLAPSLASSRDRSTARCASLPACIFIRRYRPLRYLRAFRRFYIHDARGGRTIGKVPEIEWSPAVPLIAERRARAP